MKTSRQNVACDLVVWPKNDVDLSCETGLEPKSYFCQGESGEPGIAPVLTLSCFGIPPLQDRMNNGSKTAGFDSQIFVPNFANRL